MFSFEQELNRKYHPVADLFPLLEGEAFEALKRDIEQSGQREPIWLHPEDGSIIDGRNRHRALLELELEPLFAVWSGQGGSPLAFALSLNLHRRHLTAAQKAAIAVEILPMLEEEARRRQLSHLKQNRGEATDVQEIAPRQGKAREQAAAIVGVNHAYVQDAKKIAATAPDVLQRMRSGAIGMDEARALAKLDEDTRAEVYTVAEDEDLDDLRDAIDQVQRDHRREERVAKINQISRGNSPLSTEILYPVIYLDPPWRYEHPISDSRRIENQYPTMELAELLELPIAKIATNPAVLFCWTTAPKLHEAMLCLMQWGFLYRSQIIWDKEIAGMGYYARIQHEILLIAVRGEMPAPREEDRQPSVVRIKRSSEHSEKPAEFRRIIERMYPEFAKIELFARSQPEGWAVWGNQADGS